MLAVFIISNWYKVSVNHPISKNFKAGFGDLSGTFNCSNKRCECCNYLLINDHYTYKNVQITFKLKHCFTCNSFNLIYVVICDTCKEECIGETGERKTKLRDRASVFSAHLATTIPSIKSWRTFKSM